MFEKILARYAIISNIYSCTRANYIYEEEYEKSFLNCLQQTRKRVGTAEDLNTSISLEKKCAALRICI